MKNLLLSIIKLYWAIIPKHKRRSCIFRETCSQFVYKQTAEYGFFEGLKALSLRHKKCRKGYSVYTAANGFEMELADGSIINEEEISPSLLAPVYNELHALKGKKM